MPTDVGASYLASDMVDLQEALSGLPQLRISHKVNCLLLASHLIPQPIHGHVLR